MLDERVEDGSQSDCESQPDTPEEPGEAQSLLAEENAGNLAESFLATVRAGYRTDQSFQELLANRHKDSKPWATEHGLWFRDGALVVPRRFGIREQCISRCHDPPERGHPGPDRTLRAVQQYYWWPAMRAEVYEYVATCDSCQRMKPDKRKPAGLLQPLDIPKAHDKLRHWVVDFATKLPLTESNNDSVLVLVDRFTRFTLLRACPAKCPAPEVIRILEATLAQFGTPHSLIVDQDSRFTSKEFEAYVKDIDCKLRTATVDHHQTIGLAERCIQSVKQHLRHYINADHTNWESLLPAVQSSLNNAHCDSLAASPSYVAFGMDPERPRVVATPLDSPSHRTRWHSVERKAHARLEEARRKMAIAANAKRRDLSFNIGDNVLISTKHPWFNAMDGVRKLIPAFAGPFPVTRVDNAVTYTLALPPEMRCVPTFHVSLLKPYHPRCRRQAPPDAVHVDGHEEYEVERIVKHRKKKRANGPPTLEYRVAFKGYGPERNLWLSGDALENCAEAIADYWRRQEQDIGTRAIRGAQRD